MSGGRASTPGRRFIFAEVCFRESELPGGEMDGEGAFANLEDAGLRARHLAVEEAATRAGADVAVEVDHVLSGQAELRGVGPLAGERSFHCTRRLRSRPAAKSMNAAAAR